MERRFREGDRVLVPWGLGDPVPATVVEVWGDPAVHLRVRLEPVDADDSDEPVIILISPDVLEAA